MNQTVKTYFDAFNAGDVDGMLACLSDDVAHHVNEGQIRVGKEKFAVYSKIINELNGQLPDRHPKERLSEFTENLEIGSSVSRKRSQRLNVESVS